MRDALDADLDIAVRAFSGTATDRRIGEPTSRCLQQTHDGQAHGRTVAANGRWLASGCVAGERRLRRGVADPRVCVLFTTDTPICGIICGETKKKKGGRIWRIILFRAYC